MKTIKVIDEDTLEIREIVVEENRKMGVSRTYDIRCHTASGYRSMDSVDGRRTYENETAYGDTADNARCCDSGGNSNRSILRIQGNNITVNVSSQSARANVSPAADKQIQRKILKKAK